MRRTAKRAGEKSFVPPAAGKSSLARARRANRARNARRLDMAKAERAKRNRSIRLLSRARFPPDSASGGSSYYPVGLKPYAGTGARVKKEPLEEEQKKTRRGASQGE